MKLKQLQIFLFFIFFFAVQIFSKNVTNEIFIKLKSKIEYTSQETLTLSKLSSSFNQYKNVGAISLLNLNHPKLSQNLSFSKYGLDRYYKLSIPSNINQADFISNLKNNPAIEAAFLNSAYKIHDLPNDPLLPDQWLIGSIHLESAWDVTLGDSTVLIAIIDTGIDYNHEDLSANLWLNPGEDLNNNGTIDSSDFNGFDDDNNGFVDDIRGWDFTDAPHFPDGGDYLTPDENPIDEHGHGTSVAGIAAALANNGIGIAGVAPGCRIMNLRAGTSQGLLEEDDVASAIIYAVDNGAQIINMSFGDVATSPMLRDVIQFAFESGVVLIASAGNSTSPEIHYPSGLNQVISIGATNINDKLATFSNFGSTIDIVAPGVNLKTTSPKNQYRYFSGTSAAAPVVSGVAGLILSINPDMTNQDLRNVLTSSSADLGATGWDQQYGSGRIEPNVALLIPHVSQASITTPELDQGFFSDSITIMGTASGTYLHNYELSYGSGVNPIEWMSIEKVDRRQIVNDILGNWNIQSLADTSYILRLQVVNFDGNTTEHRTRIFIDRTAPNLLSMKQLKMLDGYQNNQLIEFETDDITRAHIFFRKQNSLEDFRKIALNYEVKTHRYNFKEQGNWEFYLTLQNKSGLTTVDNSLGTNYKINLSYPSIEMNRFVQLNYNQPPLYLLNKSADFDLDGNIEFLGNVLSNNQAFGNMTVFEIEGMTFNQTEINSTVYIPRDIGDSDGDGLLEILAGSGLKSVIFESEQLGEIPRKIVWMDSINFWASRFADLDSDGKQEIIGRSENTFSVYENTGNNSYSFSAALENMTEGSNNTGVPHTEIGDFDNDSFMEILIADYDGDIYIYETTGDDSYQFTWFERLPLIDAINFISCGDYDGDGIKEFAAGCHSSSDLDLEHEYDGRYWVFRIYDSSGDNEYFPVWEQSFFGFAEPADFASGVSSGDMNGDGTDELLINIFPDFYVVDFNMQKGKYEFIGYFYPSRSQANLIIDLDKDGKTEFSVNTGLSTVFLQDIYSSSFSGPVAPAGFLAYPKNETTAQLQWLPVQGADHYQIFRGKSSEQIDLICTSIVTSYMDTTVKIDSVYCYAIATVDLAQTPDESFKTTTISVKPGFQPFCSAAEFVHPNQLRIRFSEAMDNSISNSSAYYLSGGLEQPNSTVISRSGEEVLLTLGEKSIPVGAYELEVKNVRDKDRTPIDTTRNRIGFEVMEQLGSFYLVNAEFISEYLVKLNFNLPVDESSASQKSNYLFEPSLDIDSIYVSKNNDSQVLIDIGQKQNISNTSYQITLTVQNIFSKTGIPIAKGQGSQTTLSVPSTTSTKIYAYPNPCRLGAGFQTITFANVFKNETVNVLTVNGSIIRKLQKSNGTTSLDWDLKNENGELVSSGIYIFSVSNNNRFQMGKVAVIK
jgi:subtilisin family serine protease